MNDAQLLKHLGGSTRVAELMGIIDQPGSVQRVQNWKVRGIPAKVKLDYPHLFLRTQEQEDAPELPNSKANSHA